MEMTASPVRRRGLRRLLRHARAEFSAVLRDRIRDGNRPRGGRRIAPLQGLREYFVNQSVGHENAFRRAVDPAAWTPPRGGAVMVDVEAQRSGARDVDEAKALHTLDAVVLRERGLTQCAGEAVA